MRATYDRMTDVLSVLLSLTPVEESDEIKPGVIIDYDKDGNIVGFEILDASRRVESPSSMEFNVKIVPGDETISHALLENEELRAFTDHSVTTIEDWHDEEEDRIWV